MGAAMSELDEILAMSAYDLAKMADVATPDNLDSPGAMFLHSVRTEVVEAWRDDRLARVEDDLDGDVIHLIADEAPSVYTYRRFQELLDLAAFSEELESDLIGKEPTMIDMAGLALYQIAERLAYALVEKIRSNYADAVAEAAEPAETI
jgi:hypothetical protein